jgi:hypothetical protein
MSENPPTKNENKSLFSRKKYAVSHRQFSYLFTGHAFSGWLELNTKQALFS